MNTRRPWAALLAHLVVVGVLALIAQAFKIAGWQIALGFTLGALYLFFLFKWHYGWYPDFNMDGEDQKNSELPRIDPARTNWRSIARSSNPRAR